MMWVQQNRGGQLVWEVTAWQRFAWLKHGFSSSHAGDLLEIGNRQTFAQSAGFPLPWVTCQQVHGDHIAVITEVQQAKYPATDGLLTRQPGVVLATFYADCVPVFFIDPKQKAAGIAHAGWRGTQKKIGAKMVDNLIAHYGSNIEDIQVGIGPSIGPCCFHVQDDVAEFFPDSKCTARDGNLAVNLWQENWQQLVDRGIKPENIHLAQQCTFCRPGFFSYRRTKTPQRMGALVSIIP